MRNKKGQFAKGQSGNPGGKRAESIVERCKKVTDQTFPILKRIAKGLPATKDGLKPSAADTLRAIDMIQTRGYGKPETGNGGGVFAGATIIVDTGIRRDAPQIPADTQSDDTSKQVH